MENPLIKYLLEQKNKGFDITSLFDELSQKIIKSLIKQNRVLNQKISLLEKNLDDSNKEIIELENEVERLNIQKSENEVLAEVKRLRIGNNQQRKTIIKCRNQLHTLRKMLASTAYFSDDKTLTNLLNDVLDILANPCTDKQTKRRQIRNLITNGKDLKLVLENYYGKVL